MLAVHFSLTSLAGAPVRLVSALNKYTDIKARLVTLNPVIRGMVFEQDLVWRDDQKAALELLDSADIIHLHNYFRLDANQFSIDFSSYLKRGVKVVRQFHTSPYTLAKRGGFEVETIVDDPLPQLVISQFHERYYPHARLVPNIVGNINKRPPPARSDDIIRIAYTPSNQNPTTRRWDNKGFYETECILDTLQEKYSQVEVIIAKGIPYSECLAIKQSADIVIDEVVTGSFHLSGLESLAMGIPTIAYLDQRTIETVIKITGAKKLPWINCNLLTLEVMLTRLIEDAELRQCIGDFSSAWMNKYWTDKQNLVFYTAAYNDLLNNKNYLAEDRFQTTNKLDCWDAYEYSNLIWKSNWIVNETRCVELWADYANACSGRLIVYGYGEYGQELLAILIRTSLELPYCFIDKEAEKYADSAVPIVAPDSLQYASNDFVLLASPRVEVRRGMRDYLCEINCKAGVFPFLCR